MRTSIVIFLVVAGFLSCKSQKDSTTFSREFLLQIANDPLYKAYQETIHLDAENLLLNIYDMESIGKVFDAIPFGTNICLSESAKAKIADLRGGKAYLDNECNRQDLLLKLDQKFNYSSFPEEVSDQINRLYRELNATQLEQRASDLYFRKN